jgi:uncharacterized membrane protein YhaH (DUF805 family)
MAPVALTVVLFWLALFHVLPAVLVIGSRRVRDKDLELWVIAVLFTSWLGFVAFMVVTTMDREQRRAADAAIAQKRRAMPVLGISDHRPG